MTNAQFIVLVLTIVKEILLSLECTFVFLYYIYCNKVFRAIFFFLQPFRSSTLILPAAKTTKDMPVGSYLRFDPLSKRSNASPLGPKDSYMLTRVRTDVLFWYTID